MSFDQTTKDLDVQVTDVDLSQKHTSVNLTNTSVEFRQLRQPEPPCMIQVDTSNALDMDGDSDFCREYAPPVALK